MSAVLLLLVLGAQDVDFDRDVRPILAARCVSCHGPGDANAGLALHERDRATALLESGRRALVPGKPGESELLARIQSPDPDVRMPAKGPPLEPRQVDVLRRWIAAGAPWPVHWAYRPLARPEPPRFAAAADEGWCRTPPDRFVLRALLDRGLRPSPEADPRVLLRRVSIDLTGLPPTPEDVEAFLADRAPGAYERAVDRLFASPRFGERWARHWMDLVHFAETHGHDQDRPRDHAWPYRDYLIRAFNEDTPYGRFVEDQVAGDVLRPEDPRAIVATGFLAAGPWDESSLRDIRPDSIDRLVGQYLDRDDVVATVMSTFVSTTVHCARCHDHKFDPVSQREYYGLQAVFSGIDKADREYDPDPAVARRRRDLQASLARGGQAGPAEVAAWERRQRPAPAWSPLHLLEVRAEHGSVLELRSDGSVLAGGPRPERDVYVVRARSPLARFTAIRLDVVPHATLPHKGPGRADNGNLHLSEFKAEGEGPLAFAGAQADFDQVGWECAKALDGDPTTAWGIHPQEGQPHRVVFRLRSPATARELGIRLLQQHGGGHLIGRFRLSVTDAPEPFGTDEIPAPIAGILSVAEADRSAAQRSELAAHVFRRTLQDALAALPAPARVYSGTPVFKAQGSFAPAGGPRPVHLLKRGDVRRPGPEIPPGALSCVDVPFASPSSPTDEGARRAAFARWLSHPKNVLTWRSMANRVWQHSVGRGLADTPNDFGRMGAAPSHPALLDWLATELLENGGSVKALQRLVVTSAAYRQASAHDPRAAAVDADNRLLWRMNRRRLDAETVRDAILQVSGKLDTAMGGPSVRQFHMTPGPHVTPLVDYRRFDPDDPGNHRRSVYRFLFRTLPDPFMEALDCPDGSQLTPRREASLTALQALAMLHDPFVVRQSEHAAARAGSPEELFRRVLGRPPAGPEAEVVRRYADRHGRANLCRWLFNANEFMFVD